MYSARMVLFRYIKEHQRTIDYASTRCPDLDLTINKKVVDKLLPLFKSLEKVIKIFEEEYRQDV